jgi:adenylate cyclase
MVTSILKKKGTKTVLFTSVITIVAALFLFVGFLDTWESKISDALYTQGVTLDDIVIVAIDDKSLQDLGRWPWHRSYFADVINYLNQSVVIGVDISFFEHAEGDDELAMSFKESHVVLALEYTSFSQRDGKLYGESLLKPSPSLGIPGDDFMVGFVNLYTDKDGITRSFTPHISGVEDHDHFSVSVVSEYLGITPILEESRMLIKFFSSPGGYTSISFSDVYDKKLQPSYFKDKIVLIGATAPDLHDDVRVPLSTQAMSGVEVNANIVQSVLTRDFLYYQSDVSAIGIIILFAFLTGFLLYWFRIHIASILVVVVAMAYILFSIFIFEYGIIMNILYPLLSIAMVYMGLVGIYYITEEKKRKWITSAFGKYVSPVVIDNLIKNPNMIKLGGEKREVTLFFSDIRGFTSIAEKLTPEELVHLLNEYLTEMTEIIIKNEGLVDKYMGDAIMAFWGAPLELPSHAKRACSSSLEMIEKLQELQQKWKKEDIPSFDIGIGINSGEAIVGNMGSLNRLDYTALGDTVNIASRLEGLNKIYGTNIILGEHTYNLVNDDFEARKLDTVRVWGKQEPIIIYELISLKKKSIKIQRDFVSLYEAGLDLYFSKEWKKAIISFQGALELMDDSASRIFISRCHKFLKNPPPGDWDHVWKQETK